MRDYGVGERQDRNRLKREGQEQAGTGKGARVVAPGSIVRNEANSSIADCGFRIADSGSLGRTAPAGAGWWYKQSQFAGAPRNGRGPVGWSVGSHRSTVVQTKPNGNGRWSAGSCQLWKRSQTWAGWDVWGTMRQGTGQFCETKPIPRLRIADFGLRIQEACGAPPRLARDGGTNKANLPVRPEMGAGRRGGRLAVTGRQLYKQTQFPACGGLEEANQEIGVPRARRTNKANSRHAGGGGGRSGDRRSQGKSAKRTQLGLIRFLRTGPAATPGQDRPEEKRRDGSGARAKRRSGVLRQFWTGPGGSRRR